MSQFTFWHRKRKILALFDQFRLFCHIYALFNVFFTDLTIAAVYQVGGGVLGKIRNIYFVVV